MQEDSTSVSNLRRLFETDKPPVKPKPMLWQHGQPTVKPPLPPKPKPRKIEEPSSKSLIKTVKPPLPPKPTKQTLREPSSQSSNNNVPEQSKSFNTQTEERLPLSDHNDAKDSDDCKTEEENKETMVSIQGNALAEQSDEQSVYSFVTERESSPPLPLGRRLSHKDDSGVSADESCSIDDRESESTITVIAEPSVVKMIEVFMQFIKHEIKVTDIIDHLHFISARERDIILSKHNSCPSDAFELLIDTIKKSETPGKWQSFIEAIDLKDFQYIKELIEGKTEIDHGCNRQLLKLVTSELVIRLRAQAFLDKAYEKELLTDDDKSVVEARLKEHGEHDAIKEMLERIVKHKKDWNKILIEIFKQEDFCLGDIADLFEFIKQNEQDVSITGTTELPRKRRNTNEKESESLWRQRNLLQRYTQDLNDGENDSLGALNDLPEELSTSVDDSMESLSRYQSFPTHQICVELITEIKKLRKLIKRQEQRINVNQ